jgi:3-oxoacyl-[acyl-carrier protein] reductase
MGRMENKIAVITGAGGGLCEGIARKFVKEGAKVVMVDKKPVVVDKAKEICEEGGEALGLNLDVSVPENWKIIFDKTIESFGSCNVLVNGAAEFSLSGDWNSGNPGFLENWDIVYKANVMGLVYAIQTFVPYFTEQGGGTVMNFTSSTGITYVGSGCQAYPASKAAIKIITQDMAAQHAKDHIRFNCVAPNFCYTPENDAIYTQFHDWFIKDTPLGFLGSVEDVANCALYLCSDESKYITGVCIPIDGGYTACH